MANYFTLKNAAVLFFLLHFFAGIECINAQTTITSAVSGGNWNTPATWIGAVVPSPSNNVIINSAVYVNGNVTCNNLTVNSGANLSNTYAVSPTLTVTGAVINNGSIITNPNGYSFYLDIKGNLTNNGVWNLNTTTLSGLSDQVISESAGMKLEGYMIMADSTGDVVLGSDVLLNGNTWDLSRTKIRTNGHSLMTNSCTLKNGYIESYDVLKLDKSTIASLTFSGNYTLDGNVYSQSNNSFNGTLTVVDTLTNLYASSNTINIKGSIVNNGTIINHPLGYSFYLNIDGDIKNNGIWRPNSTLISGSADHTIQQMKGKMFEGYLSMSDSVGDIVLNSDIMLNSNTFDLNNTILRTNGFKLQSKNYTVRNGKVISNDTILLDNSTIESMRFFGDYKLGGNVLSQSGNVFNDNCTIIDTLFNKYACSNTILVKGNIVNKGTIKNHPSGYILSLDIHGNVNNEGIWNVNTTNFVGSANQTIQEAKGKSFEGAVNTSDSIGDIILGSDVMFESNTWNMNNANLLTNGHKLLSNNYTLANGKIISNDTSILDNSNILNMKFYGNYILGGNVFSQSGNEFYGTATIIDTLFNRYASSNTILVKGNIVNKGTIKSHPSGYVLLLDIHGNVTNEGIWNVYTTNFVGSANQTLQQSKGKSFEGTVNTSDSIGDILLGSDLMLQGNNWNMNKANLITNGHKLLTSNSTLANGKIISNDTLFLNNSVLEGMQFFGDYKLDGNVYSKNSNVFNDTFTVLDTLANLYASTNTILINGDLINKGSIINHPWGYSLSMQIKGNLSNHHFLNIYNIYLTGTKPRTISGSNAGGIQATIFVDDSVHLTGSSTLPNINFTSNPKAFCIVDTASTLMLQSFSNTSKIINYGKVSFTQNIDNTIYNTLSFYESAINCKPGISMNKLTIDQFGNQQHPTASGTVNCWWRLRNYPQTFSDSLSWLKLSFKSSALNGNIKDSLKVYYSANAGLDWKRIKNGVTIDTANNAVTIANAPGSGHYILANSAVGITTFHPTIENAEPRYGGNSGQVSFYIYGAGFKPTSKALLRLSGSPDIEADTSYITDAIGESMLARFNLKGKSLGLYSVVVETAGEGSLILPDYFTVLQGERSAPWVALTGRDRFLINRWQTFNLNFGNTANVDARGTIMVFVINDLPNLEVLFPDFKVALAKNLSDLGDDYTRISDSVSLYYSTDTLSGYMGTKMRVYPFYVPVISSGVSKNMRVRVKLDGNGSLTMNAWIIDPFFENISTLKSSEPMPTEVRACITAAAMKSFATGAIGLIPGMGCYNLVDKIVDPIGLITPESIKPEEAESSLQSWLWSSVSWASSITQCATSFVPGLGQATQLGIGIAGMIIDSKDNYNVNEGCWQKFKKKSESKRDSRGVTSFDPNEIVGPQGFSDEHYISKNGNINYRIYFENKKTAGSSALEVFVKDTLNPTLFDFKTFSFNSISFGDTSINIQDYAKEFTVLVDMYPKKEIIVQVHGILDTINGAISWEFRSLDRITMELVEDPDLGFLMPNINSPEGEGNVAFSCLLKKTVTHNTLISNKATIVFDFNAPIVTNTYTNRIDASTPTSFVNPIKAVQSSKTFDISWSGSDEGCGILNYNIFVSEDNKPYELWKVANDQSTASFTGEGGKFYSFYCIASDSIGLTEGMKQSPETTTQVLVDIRPEEADLTGNLQINPNPAFTNCVIKFELRAAEKIDICIENVRGETVKAINSESFTEGQIEIPVDLHGFSAGLYFVKMTGVRTCGVRRFVVIK
jgi:hypothetical protein